MAMAYSNRAISRIGVPAQQDADRSSHDITPADYYGMFSFCFHTVVLQYHQNAKWSGRKEGRQSLHHLSHAYGMESVNIFVGMHQADDLVLADLFGQGKLNKYAIHIIIIV